MEIYIDNTKTNKIKIFFCFVFLLTFPFISFGDEFTSASFKILDPVIAPSGYSTSTDFSLWGTVSQIAIGTSTSADFSFNPGFLTYPLVSTPALSATAGDGQVSLSWTAAQGFLGWTVTTYSVGQSTVSGGSYSYSNVGSVTSSSRTGLTNGTTYYFVIVVNDAFGNPIATSTEVSSTPASSDDDDDVGGGGGGGGGIIISGPKTTAIFTGRAYPESTVTALRDGISIATIPVFEDALFTLTVDSLSENTYLFGFYATDPSGNRSPIFTIPVTLSFGVTTNIGGIFLAPTIDVDKKEVKRGNPIRIFGKSAPDGDITITVNSEEEIILQTQTDKDGVYAYSFITSPLSLGDHDTYSIAAKSGEVSRVSNTVGFLVGTKDVTKIKAKLSDGICDYSKGDLNCDGRINLVDFSIQAHWYKRQGFPVVYDLNKDGSITLVEFSIMASNWTG